MCRYTCTEWSWALVKDFDWLRNTVWRQEKPVPVKNMDTSFFYWLSAQGGADALLAPPWKPEEGRVSKGDTSCDLYILPPVHSTTEFSPPPPDYSSVFLLCPYSCFHNRTVTVEYLSLNLIKMSDRKQTTCLLVCQRCWLSGHGIWLVRGGIIRFKRSRGGG